MSYFLAQSLLFTKFSAAKDLLAVLLVAVVLISGSFSINFNTQAGNKLFFYPCLSSKTSTKKKYYN